MIAFSRSSSWKIVTAAALSVVGLGTTGYFFNESGVLAEPGVEIPHVSPEKQEKGVTQADTLSEAFRGASRQVLPAVVSIQHTTPAKAVKRELPGQRGRRELPFGDSDELDPLLKRFFGDVPGLDLDDLRQMPQMPQASSGSGVIINSSGIVLTNNHVVAGGGKIVVKLHDGREFEATEVKTDPSTDLAVLKIKANGPLPAATLGDSDQLQIGDWVLALGQPFGLQDTVTAGIISAKGRGIGITRHAEFLQTDAAINPGNSGGPLVNLRGEVVGINTAISSSSGGFQGVGFAVPVNVAKWVSSQLLEDGKVHRAYLGVGIQPLDQELADQLGVATPNGALVTDVQPNSPAAQAGLKSQDVIVEFAKQPIHDPRQLQAVTSRTPIGSKQPVVVMRDGKRVELQVTVREQPANYGVRTSTEAEPETSEPKSKSFDSLGLEVAPLDGDVAKQLGLENKGGVVITGVEEDSPAARAGLTPSMAVVQVGRKPIRSVEDFQAAVKDASLEKGVLLLVRTSEGSRYFVVKSE